MFRKRLDGISVLLAAQNEEEMLQMSAESFLDFADEIIIVSNGSSDRTPEIGKYLSEKHSKIQFHEVPELPDLYHNRQFALGKSKYKWIVRGDADFVCCGDMQRFKAALLADSFRIRPLAFRVRHVNLSGDFWHTGKESLSHLPLKYRTKYQPSPPPVVGGTIRVYRWVPFFKFVRRGRAERVRPRRVFKVVNWDEPLWFHCSIKSERNMFFRSERTNWRELADFEQFPTLQSYVQHVIHSRYGAKSLEEAIGVYMKKLFFPSIEKYRPDIHQQYPQVLLAKMQRNPIYRITYRNGVPVGRSRVEGTETERSREGEP